MDNKKLIINRIVRNAIIMAIYIVLTFMSYPISFQGIQFRISEILVLLCFFNRDYIIGITLGCFFTNFASPFFPLDLLIGTGATFISCLLISFCKHLGIASLLPVISNSFLIAIEYVMYLKEPYWISVGQIAIGETTIIIISYIICLYIMKKENIQKLIDVKRHSDFKW